MKDGFLGHVLLIVVLLGGLWYGVARYQDSIVDYIEEDKEQTLLIGNTQLRVTVADEPAERSQGLSGVRSLEANEGMLFIFDRSDNWSMWMKDMEISIDMLWVNSDYQVVHIEQDVKPETFPESFASGQPVRFVIETPAFFTQNNNIVVGDIVYIPETIQPTDLREPLY
jgi:uncharacterized membrane protein (UPF0127 family)